MTTHYHRLRWMVLVALISFASIGTACSPIASVTSTPIIAVTLALTPTVQEPEVVSTRWTALLEGTLDSDGPCIMIVAPEVKETYTIAWPADFRYEFDGTTLVVYDRLFEKTKSWAIGDAIQVGGGELKVLDASVKESVPQECHGPYWVFGGWLDR